MFKCIVSKEGLKVMVLAGKGWSRLCWAEDVSICG